MAAVPNEITSNKNVSEAIDIDPIETKEWLDAMNGVIQSEGTDRAAFLIDQQIANEFQKAVRQDLGFW